MAPKSGYTVTGQVSDQVILTDAGQPVTGTYVYFTTGEGNAGSVFVPDNIYPNRSRVQAMLREKASQMDEVGRLAETAE